MNNITFAQLVRQNTGSHFLDSGSAYGYNYQRPLPKEDVTFDISYYGKSFDISATIPLHVFLDKHLTIDIELTNLLRVLEEQAEDSFSVMSAADALSDKLGIPQVGRADNTYNYENDLSQNFQFTVLSNKEDWYYDEDALILVESHNGCDIRGGYSDVVVCKVNGYDGCSGLLDLCVGVRIVSGTDFEGKELSNENSESLCQHWEIGYSSCPMSEFNKDVAEVISMSVDKTECTVLLKTGETVTCYTYSTMEYV